MVCGDGHRRSTTGELVVAVAVAEEGLDKGHLVLGEGLEHRLLRGQVVERQAGCKEGIQGGDVAVRACPQGRMHAFVHRQRIGTPLQQSLGGFAQARLARAGQQGALVVVVIGRADAGI